MISIFKGNEERYLGWHELNPEGYVFNHFKGSDPGYNKIHSADCRTLWREKDHGARTKVEKICSDNLQELLNMSDVIRKNKGYSLCKICMKEEQIKRLKSTATFLHS